MRRSDVKKLNERVTKSVFLRKGLLTLHVYTSDSQDVHAVRVDGQA